MKKELLDLITLDPTIMDDIIHDVFSRRAADVNNEGPEAQVAFLLYNKVFDSEDELIDILKQS